MQMNCFIFRQSTLKSKCAVLGETQRLILSQIHVISISLSLLFFFRGKTDEEVQAEIKAEAAKRKLERQRVKEEKVFIYCN